jgi:hypothetical protein
MLTLEMYYGCIFNFVELIITRERPCIINLKITYYISYDQKVFGSELPWD